MLLESFESITWTGRIVFTGGSEQWGKKYPVKFDQRYWKLIEIMPSVHTHSLSCSKKITNLFIFHTLQQEIMKWSTSAITFWLPTWMLQDPECFFFFPCKVKPCPWERLPNRLLPVPNSYRQTFFQACMPLSSSFWPCCGQLQKELFFYWPQTEWNHSLPNSCFQAK